MSIVGKRHIFLGISLAMVLASLALLFGKGLNLGIDFRGGTLLERAIPGQVSAADVRAVLTGEALARYELGGSSVQPLEEEGTEGQSVMLIRTHAFEDSSVIAEIDAALREAFGDVEVRRTELVGPVIGAELIRQAFLAVALGALGIVAYLSFRFEYRFGIAAVAALLHDAIIALGVLALLEREVNAPVIAAILTVLGYSINATIVIFDRIRENLSVRRRESLAEIVDKSIRQTIMRSINTSATTLLVLLTLYFFGGSTIRDFTLTLLVGVAVGTYSSIFVSGPLWWLWRQAAERRTAPVAS